MHSCPAKRRLSALNAMLSAIVHARGSGLRKWLTAQHISYVGSKLLRNRAILIKPATLEQRTPEPVLSFSRVHTIRRNPSASHVEHGGRAGAIHRRCRESASFIRDTAGSVFHTYSRKSASVKRPIECGVVHSCVFLEV